MNCPRELDQSLVEHDTAVGLGCFCFRPVTEAHVDSGAVGEDETITRGEYVVAQRDEVFIRAPFHRMVLEW